MAKKSDKSSGNIQETVKMQDSRVTVKDSAIGVAGTGLLAGSFVEEYLSDLDFRKDGYATYNKMRLSDYTVQQILRAIQTTILGAKWTHIPEDPTDESQRKQADFKNKVIKEWMIRRWGESLNNILSYLTFGFAVFEPIFHVIDDKEFGQVTTLRDLGFRKQDSIYEWNLDRDGTIKSINQRTRNGDEIQDVDIPGEDIIVFTNQKEGDNYEGISILRGAYGPWKRKTINHKLDYIGLEKMAIGTPVAYAPSSVINDLKERKQLENVMAAYTSHQKSFIILDENYKGGGIEILRGEYKADSVDTAIKREDLAILNSVLLSFQAIGTMSRGGDKQTETLLKLFLDSLHQVGSYISDVLNPIIHQVYVMNFGEPETKISMSVTGINQRNFKEYAEILAVLSRENLLSPDDAIQAKIRSDLELPEMQEKDSNESPKEPEQEKPDDSEVDDDVEVNNQAHSGCEIELQGPVNRELTEFEEKIDVKSHRKDFDKSEKEFKEVIQKNFAKMRAKYIASLKNALNQSNKDRAVIAIKLGFTGQFKRELSDFLKGLVSIGEGQMARDMRAEKRLTQHDGIVKNLQSKIKDQSNIIVDDIALKFEKTAKLTALNSLSEGVTDETVVEDVESSLNDLERSAALVAATGRAVNEYINVGRNNFGFKNKDLIQGFQFSAILDPETTNICRSLDKQSFKPGDSTSFQYMPPLHWQCRSILVPILLSESKVNLDGLDPTSIQKAGKTIPRREVIKEKQFEAPKADEYIYNGKKIDVSDLAKLPILATVKKNGVEYVKEDELTFKLA